MVITMLLFKKTYFVSNVLVKSCYKKLHTILLGPSYKNVVNSYYSYKLRAISQSSAGLNGQEASNNLMISIEHLSPPFLCTVSHFASLFILAVTVNLFVSVIS